MLCSKCSKDVKELHTKECLCSKCAKIEPVKISRETEAKIDLICSKVITKIKPSADETDLKLVQIAYFCSDLLKALKGEATITLGGSMGKNTNLR